MHVPRSKVDKAYWGTVEHPLAPSAGDVEVYRRNLRPGSTLLLGCTRRLIELSTDQMDADPWCETPAMIVGDSSTGEIDRFEGPYYLGMLLVMSPKLPQGRPL